MQRIWISIILAGMGSLGYAAEQQWPPPPARGLVRRAGLHTLKMVVKERALFNGGTALAALAVNCDWQA